MKITLRFIFFLTSIITLVVILFTFFQTRYERASAIDELNHRCAVLSESLQEAIQPLLLPTQHDNLKRLVQKYGNREKIVGIAIYGGDKSPLAITDRLESIVPEPPSSVDRVFASHEVVTKFFHLPSGPTFHAYYYPLKSPEGETAILAIFHNAEHIRQRIKTTWKDGFFRWFILSLLVSLVTVMTVRWNVMAPLHHAANWIKDLRLGVSDNAVPPLHKGIFGPLAREVEHIAVSLASARAAAEEEAKLRRIAESLWTPEMLKDHVKNKLQNQPLFVISNREPYVHLRKGKDVECVVPPSGLVTGLEPVLRACGGTWIAQGSGDADRQMVDGNDRIRVPPEDPQYTLRRVWLTKEEEDGYYYGFSNEGFWPLCHIAHTRPLFKPEDWNYYQSVNRKFADTAFEEMKDSDGPHVLIQDYHFALLPRLIKDKRPDARVALFWHIPWPNPESFGICPWGRELLHGMLGADLLGFHTQFHCNNFLDTVDRVLESRIDWERFTVHRQGHITWVKPFPISVDFTQKKGVSMDGEPPAHSEVKEALLKELGLKAELIGVGVDRIDYTKGIVERFQSVERFFEKNPHYIGRFTFVELGAPSRTLIKRYHDLIAEVEAEGERINWRFKTKDWEPILFLKKQHSHKDIETFYKVADLCFVTSLHDGMNLVAKEFVAAREDESGALILSRFTGASRELRDAIIVNPYDIDQMADGIRFALEMDEDEKSQRMRRMRETVRDNNIYRWGGNFITELSNIRIRKKEKSVVL